MENFTHLDKNGNAIMVDVSEKDVTKRVAIASGKIKVCKEIIDSIKDGTNKKGDVLSVSRIAGIMACKKNSELIPLCHPLYITKVALDFEVKDKESIVEARCEVICDGKTGVEMEALTGVSVALLTIYDMCKAIDKNMVIYDICLLHKEGGKSGVYDRV